MINKKSQSMHWIKSRKIKVHLLLGASSLFLMSGCSTPIGLAGSPLWHATAKPEQRAEFFDAKKEYELCILWGSAFDSPQYRMDIASSLDRRGMNPLLCDNPTLDNQQRVLKASRAAEESARKAANAAQEAQQNQINQQIMRHGSGGCTPNFSTGGCL